MTKERELEGTSLLIKTQNYEVLGRAMSTPTLGGSTKADKTWWNVF